jgi:DNA-binding transcriptional ArsR family regulator
MKERKTTIKLRSDAPAPEDPMEVITWMLDTFGVIKSDEQRETLPKILLFFVDAMRKGERIKARDLVDANFATPSTVHKYLGLLRDAELIISRGGGYYELSKINFEEIVKEKQVLVNKTLKALRNVSKDIDTLLHLEMEDVG